MDDANGRYNAGYCYHNAIGFEKNEHKAFIYYQRSAEIGDIDGTHNAGYC